MANNDEVIVRRVTTCRDQKSKFDIQTIATMTGRGKEERDSEREAPSVTGRCFVITSRESPNLLSVVWHVVVESSASQVSSTKRPVVF